MTPDVVALDAVGMAYAPAVVALEDVSLTLTAGELVSVVGPSGCGKSTLLRIVAGLLTASAGTCRRAAGARLGMVFQDPTLLPWRRVLANVELSLELTGASRAERRARAQEAIELVGLAGFEQARPHELSGGMRMRASVARALALRPDVLLLDEPFAAVDELTREELDGELLRLWRELGFTALLVTHNIAEAVFLSGRVVALTPRPGRIAAEVAVPFAHPRSAELRATAAFAATAGAVTAVLRQGGRR